ncbi:MAG: hypothetical protein LBT77_02465 [Mycoplasmataceae bacterium]|nr:hypothetical protein [Mycoplasmataceae bacterium]
MKKLHSFWGSISIVFLTITASTSCFALTSCGKNTNNFLNIDDGANLKITSTKNAKLLVAACQQKLVQPTIPQPISDDIAYNDYLISAANGLHNTYWELALHYADQILNKKIKSFEFTCQNVSFAKDDTNKCVSLNTGTFVISTNNASLELSDNYRIKYYYASSWKLGIYSGITDLLRSECTSFALFNCTHS